jgi:hypothetical protein
MPRRRCQTILPVILFLSLSHRHPLIVTLSSSSSHRHPLIAILSSPSSHRFLFASLSSPPSLRLLFFVSFSSSPFLRLLFFLQANIFRLANYFTLSLVVCLMLCFTARKLAQQRMACASSSQCRA